MRRVGFRSLAGLAFLATAAAIVGVAHATPGSASGCKRANVMKTVFPKAGTVDFNARWPIVRTYTQRAPRWPGWCGDWRTTYTDYQGAPEDQPLRPERAFAQVRVSLYKTHRDALVALDEPAFGPIQMLPNGVRMRTLVETPNVDGDASRQAGHVAS